MTETPWVAAAVQLNSSDDLLENLAVVRREVASAARRGARLVVLPENFAYFGSAAGRRAHAERIGDLGAPVQAALVTMARAYGVSIVAGGHPETSSDPARPFNTAFVVTPRGEVESPYRKRHLFDVTLAGGESYTESATTMPGEGIVVADLGGLRCGLSICYDLRFPEHYRALVDAGAEAFVVPSAFTATTGRDHFVPLLRARAIEDQCWVVAPNQCGAHAGGRETHGHSCIIDPWGNVVAEADAEVGSISAVLDLERLHQIRRRLPALRHRR